MKSISAADDEFGELCFDFGLELDEVVREGGFEWWGCVFYVACA